VNAEQLDYVKDTIEQEGFDYTFIHYSAFEEIKDEQFQELRKKYVDAAEALKKFLNVER
jgi:hypothetical protein